MQSRGTKAWYPGLIVAAFATASFGQADGNQPTPPTPQPTPSAASPGTELPQDLADAVRDLDGPSIQTRIDATNKLLSVPSITLKQIEEILRGKVTPEQRQRLLLVAQHRFVSEPRAGMGIQWDNNFGSRGVTLGGVVPGFPAAELLRAGDRIVTANNEVIDSWETMRAIIISRDPGDEIPVTIVRDGATLNLKIRLGEFARVSRPQPLDNGLLAQAWEQRARALQDPDMLAAKPLASGLPPSTWNQGAYAEDGEPGHGRSVDSDTSRTGLVAGGEARGGVTPSIPPSPRTLNGARIMQIEPGLPQGPAPALDATQLQLENRLQVALAIRQQRAMTIEAMRQRLADPATADTAKIGLRAAIETLTSDLQAKDKEIQDLQLRMRRIVR